MERWPMWVAGGVALVVLWGLVERPVDAAPLSRPGGMPMMMRNEVRPVAQPFSRLSEAVLWMPLLDPPPKPSRPRWLHRSRRRGGGVRRRRSRKRCWRWQRRLRSRWEESEGAFERDGVSSQGVQAVPAGGGGPDPVARASSDPVEAAVPGQARLEATDLSTWVAQELAGVSLGDHRLDRRLSILVEQFARQPTASIPQACGNWASTKAAYRFFSNSQVSHRAILAGHRRACLERVAQEEVILVLQDTTSLDYTHHPHTRDLGPLEHPRHQGMLVHTCLAATTDGVPLGLLDQRVWTRDREAVGQRHRRKRRPIEEKESFKWLRGLRASLEGLPAQVCVVTVADREADIFDFFLEAEERKTQVLVRAAWNRRLTDPPGYLWDEVGRAPVRGRFTVEVGRAKDRPPRKAEVTVRFTRVTVRPPRYRLGEPGLHPLSLYAIEVREEDPPRGEKGLHWLLLTNRPVASFEQAQRYVRWYGVRWLVERYHFVLKSGCRIEARQLGTAERLQRCLGVYAIVAWRLLWLTYQARTTPEVPCTVALETHEWQALYCYIHKTPTPPAEPPSLNQAVRWIGRLGGFLERRRDGEPGVKVLWLGWQRLHDIAETWRLTYPPPDVGNA